jgi:predicted ATPase
VLTVLVPGGLVACVLGHFPWDLWFTGVLAGYVFSAANVKALHEIFDHATAGGDGLRGYAPMFEVLQELSLSPRGEGRGEGIQASELILQDESAARSEGSHIATHMTTLERLTILSDTRRGLVYFFAQVLLLWDFHVAAGFERWQRRAGASVRGWLDHLGRVEALCSLGALAHDHPDWAFPTVDPGRDTLRGRSLGHPLIPDDRCVGNDVEVGPPGSFLLVTGSNMSGKTTLLRALGANAVLAEAGAPVCAAELTLPPVRLATSVVVEDSLEDGVSFFMAELLRLKSVVDAAEEESRSPSRSPSPSPGPSPGRSRSNGTGRKVLYLLDEVLRGTNSAERRVAIRRVLHRLLELDAIGAITTHDLELSLPEGVPIHFRETIHPKAEGGAEMTFDFIARPGIAPTTNALRLLEAVGLGDPDRQGSDP